MEYNQFENNREENDQASNSQANSNINYVLKSFEELEESYEKAKKVVSKELVALWEMIAYERKQADVYRKKVQACDVMSVILPFLSDIVNDVEEATDLDELKQIIGIYVRSMRSHLKNIGVELKIHSENDTLDPTERVSGSCKMTGDKSLDGKIIRTTQIGCVIHNEEPEEIQESVLVYKYDPELEVEMEPEVENEPQTKDEESVFKLYDDQIQIVTPVEEEPVEDKPVDDTPAEETPVDEVPTDDTPAEETPVDDTPVEEEKPTIKATIDENGRYLLSECLKIYYTVNGNKHEFTRSQPFTLATGYPYTFRPHSVVSLYVGGLCVVSEYKTENMQKQLRACVIKADGKAVLCIKEGKDIIAQIEIII